MKSRRGFALLAGVWLMVAIAAVGLEVSWLARTRRLATANALDAELARAAARSGLEHARARLTRALAASRGDALADPWRSVGGGMTGTVGTARYAFDIRDDASTIDVNTADETMIARLFAACGADASAATTAAARIADWRDADQIPRLQGAERAAYLVAAARALPRDGTVLSVGELDDLLSLPASPWACVRPLLSVGGVARVNPNTAPAAVLHALPGVSAPAAAAIVGARRAGALRDWRELVAAVPPGVRGGLERNAELLQRTLVYQTDVVRVTSKASVEGSPVRAAGEALMRRMGGTVFTDWRSIQ